MAQGNDSSLSITVSLRTLHQYQSDQKGKDLNEPASNEPAKKTIFSEPTFL